MAGATAVVSHDDRLKVHNSVKTTAKTHCCVVLCDVTEPLKFGGNDSVLDFFLGSVRVCLLVCCSVLYNFDI